MRIVFLVFVLKKDVKSGELVTDEMFQRMEVDVNTIPRGATQNIDTIQNYSLVDEDGNKIVTLVDKNEQKNKFVQIDGENYLLTEKTRLFDF